MKENMDLSERDRKAIAYTKDSALLEGDVLVVIKYPNGQPGFDANGFQLQELLRVHSHKLRATNSVVFIKKLEDKWLLHRAAKRAGVLMNTLPEGIDYVIDLTPPEEGDDALELTANLCCSPGIRSWHTAQSRLGVAKTLVGGKDESSQRRPISQPTSPTKPKVVDGNRDAQVLELSTAVTSITNGETTGSQSYAVISDQRANNLSTAFDLPATRLDNMVEEEALHADDVKEATELLDAKFGAQHLGGEVLEYCPIRHRAAIERLLQVIEGKEPRLDSATKVWTLAVLGKYFDCASTVMDWVVRWTVAEPNCRFMEILPESTFKLGMILQSDMLARAGFAILVSEEALRVGSNKYFKELTPVKQHQHDKKLTRFGRAREDLDEDLLNLVQHAGRNLSSRIEKTLSELLDPEMKWLESLEEFSKLLAFQQSMSESDISSHLVIHQKSSFDTFIDQLRDYVRGRIVYCLVDHLSFQQAKDGSNHRIDERWESVEPSEGSRFLYDEIYNSLADHERMLTRQFWELLRCVEWTSEDYSNKIRDDLKGNQTDYTRNVKLADAHGIDYVNMQHLQDGVKDVNLTMRNATLHGTFGMAQKPGAAPSVFKAAALAPSTIDEMTEQLSRVKADPEIQNTTLDDWYEAEERVNSVSQMKSVDRAASYWFYEAMAKDTMAGVPRFSLYEFLKGVKSHIRATCQTVLARGECDWSVLCDTVLCLSDDEYKYLPLWAGGMNDGTGGVFEEEIPPAEKGPIGPGPSFHTGSTANSAASEFQYEAGSSEFGSHTMDGVETSLGVEDGFSDHLDRRVVYSEEDFPADHGALPLHTRDNAGQISAAAYTLAATRSSATVQAVTQHSAEASSVTISHIDLDNFFDTEDDEEGDFDMEDSESEGTVTEE